MEVDKKQKYFKVLSKMIGKVKLKHLNFLIFYKIEKKYLFLTMKTYIKIKMFLPCLILMQDFHTLIKRQTPKVIDVIKFNGKKYYK